MAKIKEAILNDLSSYEVERYLYNKHLRDVEYEDWLESDSYIKFVNNELENTKLKYSNYDVSEALMYGIGSVMLPAYEIGDELYGKLVHEKVFEYLSKGK